MKNQRKKDKETEEDTIPRHEKHLPFRWMSVWGIFCCKTGDFLEIFDPSVPTRRG